MSVEVTRKPWTPTGIVPDLVHVRRALVRLIKKVQDVIVADTWVDRLREADAEELERIAGLATDAAKLVRDPTAASLITDEELERFLTEQGGIDP